MSQPIEVHPDPSGAPSSPNRLRVSAALLAAAADREDWQQRALCAQTDPEAFLPEQGGSTAEAKAVCARCPVTAKCLEHVLAHDERFGVWAGLSEAERRKPLQAVERAAARRAADLAATTGAPDDQAGVQTGARESAPPPGPSRHVGGTGPVATLPTAPRHSRGRPHQSRDRSTFPARARQSRPVDEQPTPPAPTPSTRLSSRPTRGARASTPTSPRRRPGRSGPAAIAADQPGSEAAAASPSGATTAGPAPSAGAGDEAGTVTGPALPDPPPAAPPVGESVAEPTAAGIGVHELVRTVADVLAGQPSAPALDPAAVAAHAAGPGAQPRSRSVGEWELRILAVACVISGRATRGQTARALGVPSPAVAHWVARHQQQMPLCPQPEVEALRW